MEEVSVKKVIADLYRQYGASGLERGSAYEPDSCNTYELLARRKAFRNLPMSEQIVIERAEDALKQKAKIGSDGALSVLMRLGIFLDICAKKEAR